jgi:tetratricopeptide (TPR) repeat protein
MPDLTPELWQKVCETVDALLLLEPDRRQQQLGRLRQEDQVLATEVESLLRQHDTPSALDRDGTGIYLHPTAAKGEGDALPPAEPSSQPPTQIGSYTIQSQVGKGGMGVVWRARDRHFRRSLAVKVLAEEHNNKLDLRQRFVEEAQLMGQLQHPGIPPVYELGALPDGRPYFAMKLIKGKTLAALLKERGGLDQDQPRLLAIFEQVCQTVAYAHSQSILHRDLKPANIMVGTFGEVQVMDWGLAKLVGSDGEKAAEAAGQSSTIFSVRTGALDSATQTGQALGTPAYMAPEQARGEVAQLDQRSDVFGLGAMLCEILTGQPPFAGRNPREVLMLAQQGDITAALARLKKGADRELAQLAERCLAADKDSRPADAGAVALALTDYLAHVQERLRQAELDRKAAEVRAAEERKRRRVAYRLGSIIALLIVVLGVAGWWMDRSATQARLEREEQQLRARQSVDSLFEQVDQALATGKAEPVEPALKLIQQRLADLDASDLRQRLAQTEKDLAMLRELARLFDRRWQVVQQVVMEQLQSGQRDAMLTKSGPGTISASYTPAVSKAELRQDYAAVFAKYCLASGQAPGADLVRQVKQSRIKKALVDALDQWFLVEPESDALLGALNALDARGRPARQLLRERAAGKQSPEELATIDQESHEPNTVLCLSELLPDDRAIALLKKSAQRFPGDHRLATVLVYRLLLSQPVRAAEALSYARAAYALQPRNAFACLLVAAALQEDSQWDESISHAHQAIDLDAKNVAAHNIAGLAHGEKGEYDQAIADLKKAIELDPKNVHAHNSLGFIYNKKGDYDRAIDHLKKVIELDPKNASAHNNLGYSYGRKKDHDQAFAYLNKAIELDPKKGITHGSLGFLYNEKGDYDKAIAHLEKAIELSPKSAIAHNNLGFAHGRKGSYDKAIGLFKKSVELDAKQGETYANLGFVHNLKGEFDKSIPYLQKAIELEPKHATAHNNLGFAYGRTGDYDKAIELFKKAIELDGKQGETYANLGFVHNLKGEFDKSIPYLQKAIELEPKHATAHNNLGFAHGRTGNYDKAIELFKKAIELDDKQGETHANLGFIYNLKGDYDRAIPCLHKAIELEPKHANAHNNLGFAYGRKGNYEKAVEFLKKAIELDPKNPIAHDLVGAALLEIGRLAEAQDPLQQALNLTPMASPQFQGRKKTLETVAALVDLEPKLQNIVKGEIKPKSFIEGFQFGRLCRMKSYYASASRLYDEALALDPAAAKKLQAGDLLTLARVGALAAAGKGKDAPLEAERSQYRAKALRWLRQYLKVHEQALEKNKGGVRYLIQQNVRVLLQHQDLAPIRPPALDSIPDGERKEWQAFWNDVRTLLEQADAGSDTGEKQR